ncbi:lipoyl(octanoyl) transferase LipB [Candidatus Erwinia haradaeae]|uniref:Octanoyltransferase n=1 Tax=Candidatus Erwinia haradaeae TaxID=1922217 RepID=A0A803GCI6_9GAMM|nr:lipoyl(octanoyl) transferase LipB [Candidatus Erwinia haradaeae]VFP88117.1 Octanoyltransferase [Candidatus Erwinia haradaeae]
MIVESSDALIVRSMGLRSWKTVAESMYKFTNDRKPETLDEVWLVEHPPVFTQGQSGKVEHILVPDQIPVMQSDRGGQVTYHGPGQQLMYVMINLKRRAITPRQLVNLMEKTIIDTLSYFSVISYSRVEAPGVYVDNKKIGSLGLRIRNRCSYHGLSLNVNMDLTPFLYINPCGHPGLEMTQLQQQKHDITLTEVQPVLIYNFTRQLSISETYWIEKNETCSYIEEKS